jgi:hypothetical protein
VYQKKEGEIAFPKKGLMEKIVERAPSLPKQMGKAVETYGSCPAILSHIPNTKYPTKFMTFPVTPSNLRAENPDDHVFHRLKGRFKHFYLLPGWTLLPRMDMVEFASIKLQEIIRFYKLTKVALPVGLFQFDKEDREQEQKVLNMISKFVSDALYVLYPPKEDTETIISTSATSEITLEENEESS